MPKIESYNKNKNKKKIANSRSKLLKSDYDGLHKTLLFLLRKTLKNDHFQVESFDDSTNIIIIVHLYIHNNSNPFT